MALNSSSAASARGTGVQESSQETNHNNRSSAPPPGGRSAPNPTSKVEQTGNKKTVPSGPSASGAEKAENGKKPKLNRHCGLLWGGSEVP